MVVSDHGRRILRCANKAKHSSQGVLLHIKASISDCEKSHAFLIFPQCIKEIEYNVF